MATTVSNLHSMSYNYTIFRLQDEIISHFRDKLVCSYMRKDNSNENEEDETCTFIKDGHEFDADLSCLEHCNEQENCKLMFKVSRERFLRESVNSPPSFGTDIAAKTVALEDTATRSPLSSECSHTGSYMQEMVTHHEDFSYDLPVSSGLELLDEEVFKRADEDFSEFFCKQAATQYFSSAWKYTCVVPASNTLQRADNLNNIASISPQYSIIEKTFRNLNLEKAMCLSFVSMKARLVSYEGWVFGSIQNPVTLADCGFYYLGTKDSVRCFYCGVTIRNWRSSDDPWVVHILFRFSCEYVIAVKGEDFIRQTLIRKGIGASQRTIINDVLMLFLSTFVLLESHADSGIFMTHT